MKHLFRNRFLDTAVKIVILSGVIHVSILVITALTRGEITLLNYFDIIGISLFFPSLTQTILGNIFALATLVGLYVLILETED